jgi:hypothetical protein
MTYPKELEVILAPGASAGCTADSDTARLDP